MRSGESEPSLPIDELALTITLAHPGNEIAHLDEQRDLPNYHGGGTTFNGLTYPLHRRTP